MRSKLSPPGNKRVVQCSGRMVLRDIQGREVVKIILNFRTGPNAKASVAEDLFDSQPSRCVTGWRPPTWRPRPGSVTSTASAARRDARASVLERLPTLIETRLQILLRPVDLLAGGRPVLDRQRTERLEARRQSAPSYRGRQL